MRPKCGVCGQDRHSGGRCCHAEIRRLRSRVGRLEEVLDKMEADRDKWKRRAGIHEAVRNGIEKGSVSLKDLGYGPE